MNKKIAVLPGDGIGPEIIEQAVNVLKAIEKKYNHQFEYHYGLIGAAAIDKTGNPYPDETHELCLSSDAILLDASPLKNDRIKGADFIVVRELISGIYFGKPRGRSEDQTIAYDTCVYTKDEIQRITEKAFQFAQHRKKKVTLLDKANVLATSRLWRETVVEYAKQFPDIELECNYIDSAAMEVITKPTKFDVILTENLFGDIISDEASVITGSLGMLPSASIGAKIALYEPIHGSYPQAAGKNIANPMATILSAALLLEYSFGLLEESRAIVAAVEKAMQEGFVTEDINNGKCSTSQVGDKIVEFILNN